MEEIEQKPEKKIKDKPYLIEDFIVSLGKQSERFLDLFKVKVFQASKRPTTKDEFGTIWKSLLEDK